MAVGAAKFAHCQVRLPVEYRLKAPFRPEIVAPLDFAVRAAEIYALDRELDRAVLRVRDFAELLLETASGHPGPGGAFAAELEEDRAPARGRGGMAPLESIGPATRQFVLNTLRLTGESTRFRPPWTDSVVQEVHAVLLNGLDLSFRPGEFRSTSYVAERLDGEPLYEACPPERIRSELQAVLDWVDRFGATYHPLIPSTVLFQSLHSIRPFPVGNMTVARIMTMLYLHFFGLPNVGLVPLPKAMLEHPELVLRVLLWAEATGSYTELLDLALDSTVHAYESGVVRWVSGDGPREQLEEVALRLLTRARRAPGWFSAREAAGWVGGRSDQTVLRHLNDLVARGILESLGNTRGKRYRLVSPSSVLPALAKSFVPRTLPRTRTGAAPARGRQSLAREGATGVDSDS